MIKSPPYLTFECKCGHELDPKTTSFSKLVEYARTRGWSFKWLDSGYQVLCAFCRTDK